MNREEAIRYCDEYLARHISDIDKEFLKIAKEALQQEPCSNCCDGNQIEKAKLCQKSYLAGMEHKQEACEDVISRQAALEKVRAMQTYKLFVGDDMILVDKAVVQTELMMLPTAQPEQRWIPCSERLPEIGKQVLCCDSQSRVFTSALTEIASNGMTFFGQHCKVIAWMPLPKPYKAEGSEK